MESFNIEATRNLIDHDEVLQAILGFFYEIPGVSGCFLSGSVATNEMDEDSDLDIGVVFQSAERREAIWQKRWDWEIAPWFHRFDADHIKSYFVIYLFEPQIKADINLYLESDLPPIEGGPYTVVWDQRGVLDTWIKSLSKQQNHYPNWQEAVHEDERFWAWLFYLYTHVHRGEYYNGAYEFPAIRDILEQWVARLAGHSQFTSRRLESTEFSECLLEYDLFPRPDRESLKASMLSGIEIQLVLRREIEDKSGIVWKTEANAIEKISNLIKNL